MKARTFLLHVSHAQRHIYFLLLHVLLVTFGLLLSSQYFRPLHASILSYYSGLESFDLNIFTRINFIAVNLIPVYICSDHLWQSTTSESYPILTRFRTYKAFLLSNLRSMLTLLFIIALTTVILVLIIVCVKQDIQNPQDLRLILDWALKALSLYPMGLFSLALFSNLLYLYLPQQLAFYMVPVPLVLLPILDLISLRHHLPLSSYTVLPTMALNQVHFLPGEPLSFEASNMTFMIQGSAVRAFVVTIISILLWSYLIYKRLGQVDKI